MSRWKFTRGQAIDLQDWAIEESGAKEYLKTLPELPKSGTIKPGLYVSYEIDLTELDGGIDWPDIGIAYIYAILKNGKKEYIGEIRAYNFETLWLDTIDDEDIQSPNEWWENLNEIYKRLQLNENK
jgi:hypothetical protein